MEKKVFSSLRSFDDVVTCGNVATKEALFNVDGAVLLENYCDACAEREVK